MVQINIRADAKDALGKIRKVQESLGELEAMDALDVDEGAFDGLEAEVDDIGDSLDNLEKKVSNITGQIRSDLNDLDDIEVDADIEKTVEHKATSVDGTGRTDGPVYPEGAEPGDGDADADAVADRDRQRRQGIDMEELMPAKEFNLADVLGLDDDDTTRIRSREDAMDLLRFQDHIGFEIGPELPDEEGFSPIPQKNTEEYSELIKFAPGFDRAEKDLRHMEDILGKKQKLEFSTSLDSIKLTQEDFEIGERNEIGEQESLGRQAIRRGLLGINLDEDETELSKRINRARREGGRLFTSGNRRVSDLGENFWQNIVRNVPDTQSEFIERAGKQMEMDELRSEIRDFKENLATRNLADIGGRVNIDKLSDDDADTLRQIRKSTQPSQESDRRRSILKGLKKSIADLKLGGLFDRTQTIDGTGIGKKSKLGRGAAPGPFRVRAGRRAKVLKDRIDFSRRLKQVQNRLGNAIKKVLPNIRTIYNLVAAFLPVIIFLATSLMGLAAAFGAVAVASAAMIGMGLLSHGNDMESAFSNAQEQVSNLAEEIFKVSSADFRVFQGIQERAFERIPARVGQVTSALTELTVFEDTMFELGAMFTEGLASGIRGMAQMEEQISQLTLRFADLIGSGIKDFLRFLVVEMSENEDIFANLGSDLRKIAVTVFRLSEALASIFTAFSPVVGVILLLGKLLENDILRVLAAILGYLYLFARVSAIFISIGKGIKFLGTLLMATNISMNTLTASTWRAVAAATALVSTLTLGLALIPAVTSAIGSMSMADKEIQGAVGSQPPELERGGTVINDNRDYNTEINTGGGNIDYSERKLIEDAVEHTNNRNESTERPDPGEILGRSDIG